jgi:hypothetical protein
MTSPHQRLTRELMRSLEITADEAISSFKKGSVRREFPAQYLRSTIDELEERASTGDPAARKALKLLFEARFDKT